MNKITFWLRRLKWQRRYTAVISKIGDDPILRVKTHAKNLDEYCSRWIGFCNVDFTTPQALLESGLFVVLDAASRVANRDVIRASNIVPASVGETWKEYCICLGALRDCPSDLKKRANDLYGKLSAFVASVQLK
jgi:hypothetical protein